MDKRKLIDELLIDLMTDDHIENMIKSDNIECCVCMDFHIGVKLPNCNHFICFKCYYKMYNGYVSDTFYTNNSKPNYPTKPIYPYIDINKNLEIYNNLTDDDTYLDFFFE